jgi:O-acetyl-ADP-ribose deacetylase (regulator of RNase III)
MISYITGDLLDANQQVIIQGCNAQGVMGSGVAKSIRSKWPNVYEIYNLRYKTFGLELGDIIPVATVDGHIIVNCITQEFYGRDPIQYVSYDAIATCLEKINNRVLDWGVSEVAMPKVGAGLGGGSWDIIEQIILKSARNFIPFVYSLN